MSAFITTGARGCAGRTEADQATRPRKRVIEFSGLSGTGKSTMAAAFATAVPAGTRVGTRRRFAAPWQRHAYIGLMLVYAPRWWSLYRRLRPVLSGPAARRRVRMYIKHLWRRRQQIRSARVDLVIEDESFATWVARDLTRCPGLRPWLESNIDVFYPRRVGRRGAEYVLVVVESAELLRAQRVHRRRLAHGPAYAAAEYARYGTFASRRPMVAVVTDFLRQRISTAESPESQRSLYQGLQQPERNQRGQRRAGSVGTGPR